MVRHAFNVSSNCNQCQQDCHLKKSFKSTEHYSRKCAQLGLRIQDGSLCILRITSELLQLRTDHRKEGVGAEVVL